MVVEEKVSLVKNQFLQLTTMPLQLYFKEKVEQKALMREPVTMIQYKVNQEMMLLLQRVVHLAGGGQDQLMIGQHFLHLLIGQTTEKALKLYQMLQIKVIAVLAMPSQLMEP